MKRLGIYVLLAGVASVFAADDIVCPEGRWMTTLPHEDCHQFHLCFFGRPVEIKCPFGLYWDAIDGGCTRTETKNCMKEIFAEGRQEEVDPPHPPVETTSFPPMPPIDTTPGEDTTVPDEDTTVDETTPGDETPTPPFSTTGGTPTPPFSTTGGPPTPPVSTTDAQPTPPVETSPDDNTTGTPPEATTGTPPEVTTGTGDTEETTTEPGTGTPPTVTTPEPEETTVPTTQPPTTLPPQPTPPTCPADGIHYFRDYLACNRFFLCQNGQLIHMTCAPGQIFDQVYLRCRHDGVCTPLGF